MELRSRQQQYTLMPLSGQSDDLSHNSRPTTITPDTIGLDDVPLTVHDTPVARLQRQDSQDSSISVASSQNRKIVPDQDRSSLPENNLVERVVKRFFESVERSNTRFNNWSRQTRFYGWRMGVLLGCCMSAFVLCFNIGLAIYGSTTDSGYQGGIADLKVGSAQDMSRWGTIFHLCINAFSTMLLAASNYTMQVLSSPTRDDLDKIHRKGQWFDVGILSFRNLKRIPRQRAALSLVLAFSSIPLHLFYNAAVFQIATFNEYNIIAMQQASPAWPEMNAASNPNLTDRLYTRFNGSTWQDTYNTKYVAEHGDLFLVVDRFAFNITQDWAGINLTNYLSLELQNSDQASLRNLTIESPDWLRYDTFFNLANGYTPSNSSLGNDSWPVSAHVDHAFSRLNSPKSRLQLSLTYILVVTACNLVKLGVMIWTLVVDRSTYIVTLGDAVVSFLQRPDPITRLQCVLGKEEILHKLGYMPYHEMEGEELETHMLRVEGLWLPQRRRYFDLMGKDRQVFFGLLFCCVLSACIILPLIGAASSGYLEMRSWGTDSDDVLPFGSGPLLNAWIVNLPQIILSFCYLALNGICTSMASAQEWNNIAKTRKGLRVTKPLAKQRSTYFLQLPYRWAVPLIFTSGILHWLLSQSFFLVRLIVNDRNGIAVPEKSKTACGYSRLSLLVFFVVALVLVVAVGMIGIRHLQQKIPMAASCSLVISAACHPAEDEGQDIHLKKVKWGVVEEATGGGWPHCSIAAGELKMAKVGEKYR